MMSHLLVAVAKALKPGEKPSVFHKLCRIESGYTMNELYDLGLKLAKHWKVYRKNDPPASILCGTERPEVYIDPCNSVIIQVKAAEIVNRDMYKTNCTLRFPRIEKIREDKEWHECMTLAELNQFHNKPSGKLFSRHLRINDNDEPEKKKRKAPAAAKPKKSVGVIDHFKSQELSDVIKETNMFEAMEVCVMDGIKAHPKAELEKAVARCSGFVIQNQGPDTYCVIAAVENTHVKNLIFSDQRDGVWAAWLLECLHRKQVVPWKLCHMIHMLPSTKEYDCYGDSYFVDTDEQQLREVFGRIGRVDTLTAQCIAKLEERFSWDDLPTSMFRPFRVYMDRYADIGDPKSIVPATCLDTRALEFRFHGGTVVQKLEEGVSHVIVVEETRVLALRTLRRLFTKKFKIVRESWVTESISAGFLRNDNDYLV